MESENISDDKLFYRAFEDKYRGSRELIKTRLQQYRPFLEPLATLHPLGLALDLGCGRGEWLEVASEVGLSAHGVDLDSGMLAACTERSLLVEQKDVIQALQAQRNASVCVISAFHVVEHIAFDVLQTLVREALRALIPGGLLILETPNPENLVVSTTNFYLDPTHIRPIPPLLLEFLPEHYGYIRHKTVRLQESAPLRESGDLRLIEILSGVSPDYAVIAQKAASPEILQTFDGVFSQDYGLTLGNLSERYENTQRQRQGALDAQIAAMQTQEQDLREQVIPQLQQSQLDKLAMQQELLERERTFTAQLTVLHDQYQQAQAALSQFYNARESELKCELIALNQTMEAARDTAQHREQTLQQNLLDRERIFTTELSTIHAQHRKALVALNQSHATLESELRKEFRNNTEMLLAQVRAGAAAQVQIFERIVNRLHTQENIVRTELAQHAAYAHALATQISAMQSTWWWRLSMLWRVLRAGSAPYPAPLPSGLHAQVGEFVHVATMSPQAAQATIPTAVVPQANCTSADGNGHLDLAQPEQEGLAMPIQHITELFSIDGRLFVTEAYRNLLQREPDPQGMAYYLGCLSMGYGKARIIMQLALSAEARPHDEIKGLKKLLADERRAKHWVWGFFMRHQRRERLMRQNINELARISAHIAQLHEAAGSLPQLVNSLSVQFDGFSRQIEEWVSYSTSANTQTSSVCQRPLSEEDVRQAFREILGREPESEAVLEHYAQQSTIESLRQALMDSEEFKVYITALPEHARIVFTRLLRAQQIL